MPPNKLHRTWPEDPHRPNAAARLLHRLHVISLSVHTKTAHALPRRVPEPPVREPGCTWTLENHHRDELPPDEPSLTALIVFHITELNRLASTVESLNNLTAHHRDRCDHISSDMPTYNTAIVRWRTRVFVEDMRGLKLAVGPFIAFHRLEIERIKKDLVLVRDGSLPEVLERLPKEMRWKESFEA